LNQALSAPVDIIAQSLSLRTTAGAADPR